MDTPGAGAGWRGWRATVDPACQVPDLSVPRNSGGGSLEGAGDGHLPRREEAGEELGARGLAVLVASRVGKFSSETGVCRKEGSSQVGAGVGPWGSTVWPRASCPSAPPALSG